MWECREDRYMFGITYDCWKAVCDMYFDFKRIKKNSLKAYLQWFPLSKLTSKEKQFLKSEQFFLSYIQNGAFVMLPEMMHRTKNFLQKSDGSFRDSSLVAPILYLVLQAIGKEVSMKYVSQRNEDVAVFYAGNYECMRPSYKQDYDDYFKEIYTNIEEYQYFIKTDITNFFAGINLDKLIKRIDDICNQDESEISQLQLNLYKEYCGNGKFPLIENSIASSYLATVIYLDGCDVSLFEYIESLQLFNKFKMVRYVDDLYILLASDGELDELQKVYSDIRREYSSILKEYGLALNSQKCCLKTVDKLNDELKKSLYDERFNSKKFEISTLYEEKVNDFLIELDMEMFLDYLTIEKYNMIIEKCFTIEGIEFTPNEVFNYYVYEENSIFKDEEIISWILSLIKMDISFISLDPKRLTVMLLATENENVIKAFLNELFARYKVGKWNSYDTTIAINYLIQRGFCHADLLSVLHETCPALYYYYEKYCQISFVKSMSDDEIRGYYKIIGDDMKTFYLYFMYLMEREKNNNMQAFAYFKNFFDRVTAWFSCNEENRKFKIGKLYQEKYLKSFYDSVPGSSDVIKKAHTLRNENPVSHASAKLLDGDSTSRDLYDSIEQMKQLLKQYYEMKFK